MTETMVLTVPAGWTPGTPLRVQTPRGRTLDVAVPAGLDPGAEFRVTVAAEPGSAFCTKCGTALSPGTNSCVKCDGPQPSTSAPRVMAQVVPVVTSQPQFDPNTGQPLAPQPRFDPNTGQPLAPQPRFDPNTGQPLAPQPRFDPNTGQPLAPQPRFDPNTGQPCQVVPQHMVRDSGPAQTQPAQMQPGMQPGDGPSRQCHAGTYIAKGAPGYREGVGVLKEVVVKLVPCSTDHLGMLFCGLIWGGWPLLILLCECCYHPNLVEEEVWELTNPLVIQGKFKERELPKGEDDGCRRNYRNKGGGILIIPPDWKPPRADCCR